MQFVSKGCYVVTVIQPNLFLTSKFLLLLLTFLLNSRVRHSRAAETLQMIWPNILTSWMGPQHPECVGDLPNVSFLGVGSELRLHPGLWIPIPVPCP